jgi:hypothetical protein
MNIEKQIRAILKPLPPAESLDVLSKIYDDLKRKNSIRISKGGIKNVFDAERPDLVILQKEKEDERP